MNWDALGAIGELIGALAVVLTLAFFAIQIRHGSKAIEHQNKLAESDAVARSVEVVGQFRRMIASDEAVALLWRRGQKGEELDDVETVRFSYLAMTWFEMMSSTYFQYRQSGRQEACDQLVRAMAITMKDYPGLRSIWEQNPMMLDPAKTGMGELVAAKVKELDASGT